MSVLRASAIRPSVGLLFRQCATPAAVSVPARQPRRPSTSSCDQQSSFSTSPHLCKGERRTRDNNRLRGVSSVYRSGPRQHLSVSDDPLPRPVAPEELPPVETDPDHGLWGFFYNKEKLINSPQEDLGHGRAWTVEELRHKSWDDLHKLWWVCVKERNRIATANHERKKGNYGFGEVEAKKRDAMVRMTMRGIKHTLTERYYAWEDAVELAKSDPEIDLSGEGSTYTPMEYLEEADDAATAGEALAGEMDQEGQASREGRRKPSASAGTVDPSTMPVTPGPVGDAPRA